MKALLMGHIASDEFPAPYFESYLEERYRKQGVFFGLWAWRNVLQMDTYYGPINPDLMSTKFLEQYDIIFVVGIKTLPSYPYPDGENRCAWLKKNFPHVKVVLTSDLGESFYSNRTFNNPNPNSYERIRSQIESADVFLQLCWAYMDEFKQFLKLDNIYSIEPIDFEEYQYWFERMPK